MPELLSPAGTLEAGIAAFHYGADAVYLGMKDFSARADAGNFTQEELKLLLGIAGRCGGKVYVAVNTLLREEELEPLVDLLGRLQDLGVSALIVQDGAVLKLCRTHFPELELHASTQMALHNVEGALAARDAGFRRIVAARELSVQELGAMAKIPGLEIEAFIHGALCYSYSGLCLMSACLNGASGNRGSCTYVCRNKFRISEGNGKELGESCLFSMKDLALGDVLPALSKAGVASLKIEGRKKTPLYVAAVTNYYRKLLDGSFHGNEEMQAALDVRTIFSRPWTKFYSTNLRTAGITDPGMTGPRGIEVGQARRVHKGENGDSLRFTLKTRNLQKHDGLQVEIPGNSKPYGFGVDELKVFTQGGSDRGRIVFEAKPEDIVEVPLPAGHPDIPFGARLFCTSSQEVKQRYSWPEVRESLDRKRLPLYASIQVEESGLKVLAYTRIGQRTIGPVEIALQAELSPAQKPDKLDEDMRLAFRRLGDSDFELTELRIENPRKLYLPKSLLNEARRQTAEKLAGEVEGRREAKKNEVLAALTQKNTGNGESFAIPLRIIKVDRAFYLNTFSSEDLASIDELIFAPDRTADRELLGMLANLAERIGGKNKLRIAIPTVCRNVGGRDWAAFIRHLVEAGWRKWEIGNLGGLQMLKQCGIPLKNLNFTADWPLYAMNQKACENWLEMGAERVTTCPEDNVDNIRELLKIHGGHMAVVLWQNTVVGHSAVCAMNSMNGFCPGKANCTFKSLNLVNSKGEELEAVNDNCSTIILNPTPLDLSSMKPELHQAAAFRADFTWHDYAPNFVREIWTGKIL